MLSAALADSGYLAGLNLAGASAIACFEQNDDWKAQALKGIYERQTGVGFLKDQGARYAPFNRPNLLGLYDIRGQYGTDSKED